MKKILALTVFASSFNLFANGGMFPGGGFGPNPYGIKFDPCVANLSMAVQGFGWGQENPVSVDENGKLVVQKDKVASYEENGKVKTITYKDTNPYGNTEFIRKIEVTEEDGKITNVARYEDITAAKKWVIAGIIKVNMQNYPLFKKTEMSFAHDKESCKMVSSEMTSEVNGKDEVSVTFDKKLCDNIAPLMSQMGKQNAAACGSLFSQIEQTYKTRNKELMKSGKELALFGMMGGMDLGSASRDFTMSGIITNCMMVENPIYPGMGYGVGWGYPGVGSYGGYGTGAQAQQGTAIVK